MVTASGTQSAFSLDGRVAFVTGGNGGLGLAVARGLAAAGADVAIGGRDRDKMASALGDLGPRGRSFVVDVTDESSVASAIDAVEAEFGRLDVLVNNAGSFAGGPVTDLSLSGWREVLDSHLTGAFLCSKYAARTMISRREGGKIVNVGSMYSLFGPPDFADYASAKAGVLGLTRALAVELAPHRIQANAILPGWFETDLTRGMPASELGHFIERKTPAGRWGDVSDLVGPVVFLASAASDFVTGVTIPVDGGYSVCDRPTPLRDEDV